MRALGINDTRRFTQCKLRSGNTWTVGFIKPEHAEVGARLRIAKREWEVVAVWVTEPAEFVAWWYKTTRA